MRNDEIFDSFGRDGIDNKEAWNRLPNILRYFISSQQSSLYQRVKRKVVEKYGENGLKSLVKTSGYRSHAVNSRVGGVTDSLHLYGCAIDFGMVGIFKDNPIPVCCELECIKSKNCWHVQFKRG